MNIGVFIDAENISYIDIPNIMSEIHKIGRIIVSRVYADWSSNYVENWKDFLVNYTFEPIHCAKIPRRNSIDIKMIDDIYDILHFRQTVDTYILVSNDIDYLTMARKIKIFGKTLITFGYDNCSEILKNISDKFINIKTIINEDEIELDNVFEESNIELDVEDEVFIRKIGDNFADAVIEVLNNEKHLNYSTLKHRLKKKILITDKIEDIIKYKYNKLFRICEAPTKKKRIYDITAIDTNIYDTIDEQFLEVFKLLNSHEILIVEFIEKLKLIINNFDYSMWGFLNFNDMINTLFYGKFIIIEKNNNFYIVNCLFS